MLIKINIVSLYITKLRIFGHNVPASRGCDSRQQREKMATFAPVMRQIFIFNPDNDLALASGSKNYTAPPFAQQLRLDLQLLPAWFAPPGAAVICDHAVQAQTWLNSHGLDVEAVEPQCLASLTGEWSVEPWGWSPAIRHYLKRMGSSERWMPATAHMPILRNLSHRRTSVAIHQAVTRLAGKPLCACPVEIADLAKVDRFAANGECYVKSPWSGSGRGVYHLLQPGLRDFKQWCGGIIKRQGSVLCEKAFNRIMDFALELRCDCGECHIDGYSVFTSDFHSQYQHGIVDSPEGLRRRIATLYPHLDDVERWVAAAVRETVASHYTGWLGVDMLLFGEPGGAVGINPCVELNLRPTMGLVAAALGKRGMRGKLVITDTSHLANDITTLTPVAEDTKYCAALLP